MSKQANFKTSVGGQALIEGIMMRGPESYCVAVRCPNGEIDAATTAAAPTKASKIPIVRGVLSFVGSLTTGYKCLMRSADIAMPEGEEADSKFEKWLSEKLGEKGTAFLTGISAVLGGSLAIVLFMVLPTLITGFLARFFALGVFKTALEGVLKIAIFLCYLLLISQMKDIRRMFQYHGAEHKTIACYEAGEALTVENVRTKSRFHPRCGTSFILIVLVVSIVLFSFLPWTSTLARVGLKLLLLPLVVGISYEFIRYAGRHNNWFTRLLSAPGLWLQRLTTKEPLDDMIEVAIAAVIPVLPKNREDAAW